VKNTQYFLEKDVNGNTKVYGCGYNYYGQLGLGHTTTPQSTPQEITYFNGINITQIACGGDHTIFLASDGSVYGCGYNGYGQLGFGHTTTPQSTIQKITHFNGTTITQIACGQNHTIFLASDGIIYGCGRNEYGQLGLGYTTSSQSTPHVITFFSGINISQIACGYNHTIFLAGDGKLYSCGYNLYGQLGLGHTTTPQSTIQEITYFNDKNITQIASSGSHAIFLASNGSVYSCGSNEYGQLGLGNVKNSQKESTPQEIVYSINVIKITHVACGREHTFAYIT